MPALGGCSHAIALDVGQARDPAAIVVLERHTEDVGLPYQDFTGGVRTHFIAVRDLYHVRLIERPALGTPYHELIDRVCALEGKVPGAWICVDATGVGRPIVEQIAARMERVVPIVFTGGHEEHYRPDGLCTIPKKNLVGALQQVFQTGRIRLPKTHPLLQVVLQELYTMRMKQNPKTGNESYEAWREGDHDDLVFALAMAAWWMERHPLRCRPLADPELPDAERAMFDHALEAMKTSEALEWER